MGRVLVWIALGLVMIASAITWSHSYRSPIFVRYSRSVGQCWLVVDRGLVQAEVVLDGRDHNGWVINDLTGMGNVGWRDLQLARPGWRSRVGLATWSFRVPIDSGLPAWRSYGRVVFFPLMPAVVAVIVLALAMQARSRTKPPTTV